jgi:hypothetical protein
MNTLFRWSLALIAAAIVGAALFFGGMVFARFGWGRTNALLNRSSLWPDGRPMRRQALLSRRWGGANGPLIYGPMGCWATIDRPTWWRVSPPARQPAGDRYAVFFFILTPRYSESVIKSSHILQEPVATRGYPIDS